MTQYAEDLATARCANPGCTHEDHTQMFLHAKCHPQGGLDVAYNLIKNALEVSCARCHKPVGEIAVARRG